MHSALSLTIRHKIQTLWLRHIIGFKFSNSHVSYFQYSVAVAARTIDDSLGRLSQRVAVKVKPEDVPLNLRGEGVTTHTMRLTWGPPIR